MNGMKLLYCPLIQGIPMSDEDEGGAEDGAADEANIV
jgi:hypothetical protein